MKIYCDACGISEKLETNKEIAEIGNLMPRRWYRRVIEHRAYILCDVCGHPKQFMGGELSRYILDVLNLPENSHYDQPEKEDFF
jgi:hypothetical protein